MKLLTLEQERFLLDNYVGITSNELAKLLNYRFHTNFTRNQIKGYLTNHGLKNGVVRHFEKGHVPANKGKKGICAPGSEKGWFKPGQLPPLTDSIGTEKILKDGYVWVKINNISKAKKKINWKQKHVLIYEETYGSVPEGHIVIFLDGNTRNFEIDNLQAIDKATNARLNQNHLRYTEKRLTEAGIAVAQLITTASKAKRRIRRNDK